jgi:hypothetical protein
MHYDGIKLFSSLPCKMLKSFMNHKAHFKVSLRRCLNTQSFYFIDEVRMLKNDS